MGKPVKKNQKLSRQSRGEREPTKKTKTLMNLHLSSLHGLYLKKHISKEQITHSMWGVLKKFENTCQGECVWLCLSWFWPEVTEVNPWNSHCHRDSKISEFVFIPGREEMESQPEAVCQEDRKDKHHAWTHFLKMNRKNRKYISPKDCVALFFVVSSLPFIFLPQINHGKRHFPCVDDKWSLREQIR